MKVFCLTLALFGTATIFTSAHAADLIPPYPGGTISHASPTTCGERIELKTSDSADKVVGAYSGWASQSGMVQMGQKGDNLTSFITFANPKTHAKMQIMIFKGETSNTYGIVYSTGTRPGCQ